MLSDLKEYSHDKDSNKNNSGRQSQKSDCGSGHREKTNMGYYRFSHKRGSKPFPFGNHARGFGLFWDRISQVQRQKHLEEIIVGFESTGSYGVPLVHFLNRKGVKLVQVNPMHTKRLKELDRKSVV